MLELKVRLQLFWLVSKREPAQEAGWEKDLHSEGSFSCDVQSEKNVGIRFFSAACCKVAFFVHYPTGGRERVIFHGDWAPCATLCAVLPATQHVTPAFNKFKLSSSSESSQMSRGHAERQVVDADIRIMHSMCPNYPFWQDNSRMLPGC